MNLTRHQYKTTLRWTGNSGTGTSGYKAYSRRHEITGAGKPAAIPGSSDPHFRGSAERYNPEELLVASLSACHMLSYLHLCAVGGVVVTAYEDDASGEMIEHPDGGGDFAGVVLRPRVTITPESDPAKALHLHEEAGRLCFIARSVRFPVTHEPTIQT
ncbi:MAG: OsmC family protein [Acidobacteriota bacterium]|nr:OsmC family protein [Acidobacteriota bacterium]